MNGPLLHFYLKNLKIEKTDSWPFIQILSKSTLNFRNPLVSNNNNSNIKIKTFKVSLCIALGLLTKVTNLFKFARKTFPLNHYRKMDFPSYETKRISIKLHLGLRVCNHRLYAYPVRNSRVLLASWIISCPTPISEACSWWCTGVATCRLKWWHYGVFFFKFSIRNP